MLLGGFPGAARGWEALGAGPTRGGAEEGAGVSCLLSSASGSGEKFPGQLPCSLSLRSWDSSSMTMILGYWDIRGVREGSTGAGGEEAGRWEMRGWGNAAQLGACSTRSFCGSCCRGAPSLSLSCLGVAVGGWGGRLGCRGGDLELRKVCSGSSPLTSVTTISPSWPTPSACSWSTQTPATRRRSTRWGTVMASCSVQVVLVRARHAMS